MVERDNRSAISGLPFIIIPSMYNIYNKNRTQRDETDITEKCLNFGFMLFYLNSHFFI